MPIHLQKRNHWRLLFTRTATRGPRLPCARPTSLPGEGDVGVVQAQQMGHALHALTVDVMDRLPAVRIKSFDFTGQQQQQQKMRTRQDKTRRVKRGLSGAAPPNNKGDDDASWVLGGVAYLMTML